MLDVSADGERENKHDASARCRHAVGARPAVAVQTWLFWHSAVGCQIVGGAASPSIDD
ncbi:MAG: hypothetical protein IJ527_01025 [Prevotella sp.]|nr:hypothetical protein [Prevotella sp.]